MSAEYKTEHGRPTCEECNWANTSLWNIGEPGKPRWICHGCVRRSILQRDSLIYALNVLRSYACGEIKHDKVLVCKIINGALEVKEEAQ